MIALQSWGRGNCARDAINELQSWGAREPRPYTWIIDAWGSLIAARERAHERIEQCRILRLAHTPALDVDSSLTIEYAGVSGDT